MIHMPPMQPHGQPIVDSVLDLIGNTPLVEVTAFDLGKCRLFAKLESRNPGGSIKDRIALSMIEQAECSGLLRPGGVIVEATAGNTGIGLALVAAAKSYRVIAVIPDKMSREKVQHLRGLGAEVHIAVTDVGHDNPDSYIQVASRIAKSIPGAWLADQFSNPANPDTHERTTGPEIWSQLQGHVDAVVCGVGSGGTLTGLSRFFARVSPHTAIVLADPEGSSLAEYVRTGVLGHRGSYHVEGIGQATVPKVADLSRVACAYTIPDDRSFEVARALLLRSGLFVGSSSGTLIAAAVEYCRAQSAPKRVVTFVCDCGSKYMSKMFNDDWMLDRIATVRRGEMRPTPTLKRQILGFTPYPKED